MDLGYLGSRVLGLLSLMGLRAQSGFGMSVNAVVARSSHVSQACLSFWHVALYGLYSKGWHGCGSKVQNLLSTNEGLGLQWFWF